MENLLNPYSLMRRSCRARLEYQLKGAITFDLTVGSRSNFYRSFRRPFSLENLWNPYSLMSRSCHARLEYQFKKAITFDPTLDCAQIFTRVSGVRFPCSTYGIPTR
jgi:hypothetical protein